MAHIATIHKTKTKHAKITFNKEMKHSIKKAKQELRDGTKLLKHKDIFGTV